MEFLTMLHIYLLFVFTANVTLVSGFSWLGPERRKVYGYDGKPLSMKWKLTKESYKDLFNAEWKVARSYSTGTWLGESVILLAVADERRRMDYVPRLAKVGDWGEVTLLKLKSEKHKVIMAKAESYLGKTTRALADIVYIKKDAAFKDSNGLKNQYRFYLQPPEKTEHVNATIIAQGDPEPAIHWTFNDKDVSKLKGFKVMQRRYRGNGLYFVESSISKDFAFGGDGTLEVVVRHPGTLGEDLPIVSKKSRVTIERRTPPSFFNQSSLQSSELKSNYLFQENTESAKHFKITITAQGYPDPSITWTNNGKNAKEIGFQIEEKIRKDGMMFYVTSTISKTITADNKGTLTFIIDQRKYDYLEPSLSKEITTDVLYAPRNVRFSHNVTKGALVDRGYIKLTCKADSNPPSLYTIEENPEVIYKGRETSSVVYLDDTKVENEDRSIGYRCIAINYLGQDSSTVQLAIAWSDKVKQKIGASTSTGAQKDGHAGKRYKAIDRKYMMAMLSFNSFFFVAFSLLLYYHIQYRRFIAKQNNDFMKMNFELFPGVG